MSRVGLDVPSRAALAGVLVLATGLRLGAVVTVGAVPELHGDEPQYVHAAFSLARGDGYPGSARPPGYPAFLALVARLLGSDLLWFRLAQVAVALVGVALVFVLVQRRFGRRAALGSALGCAATPDLIHATHYLWSETLLATLLLLALLALQRVADQFTIARAVLAGLVLAVATLTREMTLYCIPLVALGVGAWSPARARWRCLIALGGAFVAGILPWSVRNWTLHHSLVLISTTRWYALAEGNLLAGPDAETAVRSFRRAYLTDPDELRRERGARAIALESIASQQPWWIVRKATFNSYLLLAPSRSQHRRFYDRGWLPERWRGLTRCLLPFETAATALLIGASLAGLWLVAGGRLKLLAVSVLLTFWAIYVLANATNRFRTPLLPLGLLFVGPLLAGRVSLERWRLVGLGLSLTAFAGIVVVDLACPPDVPFPQY